MSINLREALKSHLSFLTARSVIGILLMCSTFIFFLRTTHLVLNQSSSLPHKAFLILKGVRPVLGECVAFTLLPNDRWKGVRVIKRVVGVAGDTVRHVHNKMWVGNTKVGVPLEKAKDGGPLTPLTFKGVIPDGYFFVVGSHERSFDSRYEEVGLIPEQHMIGKAIPLF